MKLTYYLLIVKDTKGNSEFAIVFNPSDPVYFHNLKDSNNKSLHYEGSNNGLKEWVSENDLHFFSYKREETFWTHAETPARRFKPQFGETLIIKDGDHYIKGLVIQEELSNCILLEISGSVVVAYKDGSEWVLDRETNWRNIYTSSHNWIEPAQKPGFHKISLVDSKDSEKWTDILVSNSFSEGLGLAILDAIGRKKNEISDIVKPDEIQYQKNGIPVGYRIQWINGKTANELITKLLDDELPF